MQRNFQLPSRMARSGKGASLGPGRSGGRRQKRGAARWLAGGGGGDVLAVARRVVGVGEGHEGGGEVEAGEDAGGVGGAEAVLGEEGGGPDDEGFADAAFVEVALEAAEGAGGACAG